MQTRAKSTAKPKAKKTAQKPTVSKGGNKAPFSAKAFFKSKGGVALVIIIAVGITLGIGIPLSLSIGNLNVTPADHVSVQITNAGDMTNMTTKFSATAYTVDPSKAANNATFNFYKQWLVGVNGSAADLSLKIGTNGDAFVIRLTTTEVGYGNFSDFSFWAEVDGVYSVSVYKDPSVFTTAIYDAGMSANITGDPTFTVRMNIPAADEGYQTLWQPQIYNDSISFFSINFTYNAPVTLKTLNITNVYSSPYGAANYVKWGTLSNGNKSITYLVYIVAGGNLPYIYDFATIPSVANITRVAFQFGDVTHSSRVLKVITI